MSYDDLQLDEQCAGCPDCAGPAYVPDAYSNDCRRDNDEEDDEGECSEDRCRARAAAHDRAITEHRRRTAYGS